jgi:hypothetical protein
MKAITTLFFALLMTTSAFAFAESTAELQNVSLNTEAPVVGCIVNEALEVLGVEFEVLDVMSGVAIGTSKPALSAELRFLAFNNVSGEKKSYKMILKSTDTKKGWVKRTDLNGTYVTSTKVSTAAVLKDLSHTISAVDISSCRP